MQRGVIRCRLTIQILDYTFESGYHRDEDLGLNLGLVPSRDRLPHVFKVRIWHRFCMYRKRRAES